MSGKINFGERLNSKSHVKAINELMDGNVNGNVNVNIPKREKFEEKHVRATFYIDRELMDQLNAITRTQDKGAKTFIINEALNDWLKKNIR